MITFKSIPITFFTAHPHVGTKGIPAPLCALFSDEIRCHYIGKGLLFRLSKCSRHPLLGYVRSTAVVQALRSFLSLSFIHMIKGLWLTHFFRDLNKTVTNLKRLTKLVTFGPSCISCRLTIQKLHSKTELLYVLMGEVGEHVRAFASESQCSPTIIPPSSASADTERGPIERQEEGKRESERGRRDESMPVWCGTRDVKHAGIGRVKRK